MGPAILSSTQMIELAIGCGAIHISGLPEARELLKQQQGPLVLEAALPW